jgi:hypothetical protein
VERERAFQAEGMVRAFQVEAKAHAYQAEAMELACEADSWVHIVVVADLGFVPLRYPQILHEEQGLVNEHAREDLSVPRQH